VFGIDAQKHVTGLVLVLTHYEVFVVREPAIAHAVLDIVATQARNASLAGHRVICLVQSDDPQLSFPRSDDRGFPSDRAHMPLVGSR
jgi:hypothetical protein